jgi:3-hydroxyisobutyrate dehydrogenase
MFAKNNIGYQALDLPDRFDWSDDERIQRLEAFYDHMKRRHTVRDFTSDDVPQELIETAIRTAGTAPSGANHQPWHFVAIKKRALKVKIRQAAEVEEETFYAGGAGDEWLSALEPIGTNADKPHLETAPWLIVVFAQRWGHFDDGTRYKNYYVPKSVGIATGFLVASLHQAGLGILTHTPNPMKFLNALLGRPAHEKPVMILAVGKADPGAKIPAVAKIKKPLDEILSIFDESDICKKHICRVWTGVVAVLRSNGKNNTVDNTLNRDVGLMKVGFIGLGNVGAKLSGSLLRNGIDLTVHDLNADLVAKAVVKGAKAAEGPAQMMRDCDAVITCLPSPAASDAVMAEMLPEIGPGKIWMEMSTTDQAEAERLGALVIQKGGAAVDCPVSGGCHRADTGNIAIFAGCDRATFERILPFLTTMGRRILHTGPLGSASMLKVLTNYLATANLVTCSEALVVAKAAGMDLNTTYEAMKISSGNSFVHETESQVILNGSRDISFTMDLVKKDIGLFQDIADRAGVELEISPKLIEIFEDGIARYGPRELSPNIIRRLEDATGLDIRADGFPSEMVDDEPEEPGYEIIPTGAA